MHFQVRLADGSTKRMDELTSDDWIETVTDAGINYYPIDFWLHKLPNQEAEFHKITTADGNNLKLTAKHFIFRTSCDNLDEKVSELLLRDLFVYLY